MDCTRYAIWWVPRPGSELGRFGLDWTGWCADRGTTGARRALAALSRPRAGVPGAVRLRGLHASVKSAFRLAPGRSAWALEDAVAELAGRTAPIRLPRLRLAVADGRVVLTPMRPDESVTRLLTGAAEAVLPFEVTASYAALTGAGAGMGSGAVAAGGIVLPDRPEDASVSSTPERFRLPLTDRMDPAAAAEIVAELAPFLADMLARPQTVADLALVGDPGRGRPWRLLERYALDGEVTRRETPLPAGMDCRGPSLMAPLGSTDKAAV